MRSGIKQRPDWIAKRTAAATATKRARSIPLLRRIFAKVHITDGCWLFTGALDRGGYPVVTDRAKQPYTRSGHREVFEALFGPLAQGECVCHSCDNTACLRPSHFFRGTVGDNNRDCWKKGRHAPICATMESRNNLSRALKQQFATGQRVVVRKSNGQLAGTRTVLQ